MLTKSSSFLSDYEQTRHHWIDQVHSTRFVLHPTSFLSQSPTSQAEPFPLSFSKMDELSTLLALRSISVRPTSPSPVSSTIRVEQRLTPMLRFLQETLPQPWEILQPPRSVLRAYYSCLLSQRTQLTIVSFLLPLFLDAFFPSGSTFRPRPRRGFFPCFGSRGCSGIHVWSTSNYQRVSSTCLRVLSAFFP